MKTSASFNLKTGLLLLGLCALPFAGCEKDNTEPNRGNNNQPQKHNVELKYGETPSTNWQHIEMDTIYNYCSDPTVDSIFMIPEITSQFDGLSTVSLKGLASKLRERHNVNPNKVFGKGNLILNAESVQNNPEIVRFFADTLRYNVTTR
jgi:hypothetical protein